VVYNYDGMVSPHGGEAGSEDPRARLSSPLVKGQEHTGPRH
jgi:hypothetical protein